MEWIKSNKKICSSCIIFVLSFFLSILGLRDISIIMLLCASILLIFIVKDITGNFVNFSTLFCCFHVLYGLAGVISKAWLNQFSSTYDNKFTYCPYLVAYALCSLFLLLGIVYSSKKNKSVNVDVNSKGKEKYFLLVAYVGFAITSIFEFINFLRVGGFPTLFAGKAIYQALADELILTLPSLYTFYVSLASYCVYLCLSLSSGKKFDIKQLIISLVLLLPYLFIILTLGRRGPLLAIFIFVIVMLFAVKPLTKIKTKHIAILGTVYIILGLTFVLRGNIKLMFSDFPKFKEKMTINYVLKNLNPALSEFGCTYGNFNKFYVTGDYELLYGKSYVEGLVHVIPTYVYPGEKPKMITYEFRDKYFPKKSEISSIASTGFSSILETYWNFWYFGSIIYFFYGYILIFFENKIKSKNYFCLLEYFSLLILTYSFHRSDFGHTTAEIILITAEVLFIYVFHDYVFMRNEKLQKLLNKI